MKLLAFLKNVSFPPYGNASGKRFYQPYKDLGKFKLTASGLRRTPLIQKYVEHLFRRSNTKSVKANAESERVFSIYKTFQNMFYKKN